MIFSKKRFVAFVCCSYNIIFTMLALYSRLCRSDPAVSFRQYVRDRPCEFSQASSYTRTSWTWTGRVEIFPSYCFYMLYHISILPVVPARRKQRHRRSGPRMDEILYRLLYVLSDRIAIIGYLSVMTAPSARPARAS